MDTLKKGQYAEIMTEYAEHIYRASVSETKRNYMFKSPEGTMREVDICTTLTSGERIAFEVRDRHSTQGIDWIDQVIGKYNDSDFKYVWICTFDGCKLSKDAIKKLEYHHIGWRDFQLLNEFAMEENPIIMISGIELLKDEIVVRIGNEVYQDVRFQMTEDSDKESYIDIAIGICTSIIQSNFHQFDEINIFTYTHEQNLNGIKHNFDDEVIKIEIEIHLKHTIFVDYFDEKYIVNNNQNEEILLSTNDKSIFITNDTLIINFGYICDLMETGIIDSNFLINLQTIPEEYRNNLNKVKFVDVSGKGNCIPMKMYGINY